MMKDFEKADAFDSIVVQKEEEAKDLTNIAIRMQHNIDLQGRLNEDYRKQIAEGEKENVNCQREKEEIIKSEKSDKWKKIAVAFIIGAFTGSFAEHFLK